MKTYSTALVSAAACGLLGITAARADILTDNLGEPTRDVTLLSTVEPDNIWAAQAFRGPGYAALDSIEVLVGNAGDGTDVVAELRAGDGPDGPLVATFTIPAFEAVGVSVATLVPDSAVVLEPGTVYWLVMGTATTGSFGWAYAEGNAFTGTGELLGYAYSYDQGGLWGAAGTDNPYQMRVNVTPTCGCPSDFNCDGFVTGDDFDAFVEQFVLGNNAADFNGDGFVTGDDYDGYVDAFALGC